MGAEATHMAQEEDPEKEWVAQARRGDEAAFAALIRLHQRSVYGLALRMTGNHADADDLAQRTFLRAWDGLSSFEERSSLKTWLLTICTNLCRNHHRDRRRFVEVGEGRPELSTEAVGASSLEARQVREKLREAIATLPPRQRCTVELRVYQDLPFREVALALETTENAAKVNFHFAVKALRDRLAGLRQGGES